MNQNILFLYELSFSVRKLLLDEIEKICSAYFSGSIDFTSLQELAEIALKIQSIFSESIFRVITSKLSEDQLMIIGPDYISRMSNNIRVSLTIDELLVNWVASYYQTIHQYIKNALETDSWNSVDLDDKVAGIFEFVKHLDRPHDESETFIVVKKSVMIGTEQYQISKSFLILIETLNAFMQLIFKKKVATYHLSMRMVELVMVGLGDTVLQKLRRGLDSGGAGTGPQDYH